MTANDPRLNLTVTPSYESMSNRAADIVAETVQRAPSCALALPTGGTPLGMFRELISRVVRGVLDLGQVQLFCLDEYLGFSANDANSLTGWLYTSFIRPAGIPADHVHAVPSTASDLERAAGKFEAKLAALGGLELAVLGLGPNGHIAYNEPGSTADSRTRILTLTPESIAQASGYWDNPGPIPNRAMTVGVGTLLEAKRIVLIVSGADKAEMLRRALEEPMTADVPASWLRLAGTRFEAFVDESAASALTRR